VNVKFKLPLGDCDVDHIGVGDILLVVDREGTVTLKPNVEDCDVKEPFVLLTAGVVWDKDVIVGLEIELAELLVNETTEGARVGDTVEASRLKMVSEILFRGI